MPHDHTSDQWSPSTEADHSGVLIAFGVMALSGAVVGFLLGLWAAE